MNCQYYQSRIRRPNLFLKKYRYMYIERDNVAATAAASAISQSAEFAE